MNLRELFEGQLTDPRDQKDNKIAHLSPILLEQSVMGLTSDSREVRSGTVFVAIRGESLDGHTFIEEVDRRGTLLIVGEDDAPLGLNTPYLKVADSRLELAFLSASYYRNPSRSLLMLGITGTSGKTTTSYLIESILQAAGHRVGIIGTVNFRYGSKIFPSTHTTPGPIELQSLLSQMKDEGCTAVVMEVSSHALKQKRVASICFDGMVFTNLTPEHLDFHPDMEDYFHSKEILFTDLAELAARSGKFPVAVVNQEDSYGLRLLAGLKRGSPFEGRISHFGSEPTLRISIEGIHGDLNGIPIQSHLTGQFNCGNIAAAVGVCHALGIPQAQIAEGVARLRGVPGRLERVENPRGIHIWVDYAHKPDALEKVIKTLGDMRQGHRLFTVFGCGGDRDRTKRPVMGRIAVEGSDHVVITSDNPRTEDPSLIIEEILVGTQGYENFTVEVDRRRAIFRTLESATPGDLVLIAGKGHEDYQILGRKKIHFDDREVAFEAVLAASRVMKPV